MILYLDTSAFLKLYLEERESARVRQGVSEAVTTCTHLIAYAEMRAGLAQVTRMNRMAASDLTHQVNQFEADWIAMEVILADEPLIRRAGNLAEQFGLRGYDSVHLAAAERVSAVSGGSTTCMFAAFDKQLQDAAVALGLSVLK